MANAINIPKSYVIMGLCLPLAVVVGYFLAEPTDLSSVAVFVMVLAVFSVPALMKWYHPLLVLSWNACLVPFFLPVQMPIWAPMALLALLFAVLNRSVNPYRQFIYVPSLTRSLLALAVIVVVTGLLTGGFGFRVLGSGHVGSKRYFFILVAIAGYFGLTSQPIPPNRAGLYLGMFFLPALTALVPNLAAAVGSDFAFLYDLFPLGLVSRQQGPPTGFSIMRIGGFTLAGPAVGSYLLGRYGLRGVLDMARPWRGLLFVLAGVACAFSGFRSILILFGLTVAAVFFWERLHRTHLMPLALLIGLSLFGLLFLQARRLPLTVQRTISFLPVKVDPVAQRDADDSTKWRVDMWKQVLLDVPGHLLKGKGYTFDPEEMYFAAAAPYSASLYTPQGGARLAGDYHNGPLSVVMPFGLWGVGGFVWFVVAALRYLHRNYRLGDPELRLINTFLLAAFSAKLVFFVFVFGALSSDLWVFIGLVGLSVSLNGRSIAQPGPELAGESLDRFAPGV